MKNLKKRIKEMKAITLISLVITIVILIILAGITISLTLGNNGLFNRAKYARDKYVNSVNAEEKTINDLYGQLQIATSGQVTIDYEKLGDIIDARILRTYPVGSIYISISNTNPSEFIGGTWEEWGSGKVPVAVDTNEPNFNTVEKTGGTISQSYTPAGTNSGGSVGYHTLTVAEIPSHSHALAVKIISVASNYGCTVKSGSYSNTAAQNSGITATNAAGGGGAHNHPFTQPTFTGTAATISHLQPYITCYMWKRIS